MQIADVQKLYAMRGPAAICFEWYAVRGPAAICFKYDVCGNIKYAGCRFTTRSLASCADTAVRHPSAARSVRDRHVESPGVAWVAMPHAACDVSAVSAGILLDYTRSVTRRWPRRAAKLAPISITLQNYNLRQSSPPFPTGGEWDCPPIRGRSRRYTTKA